MVDEEQISTALRSYDMGTFRALHKGHQGFANLNYRLQTSKGVYLYRVNLEQPLESIHYEHRLLHYLDTADIPVALPQPRTDGEFITDTPVGPVVLYDFIEGGIPESNPATVAAIARASARLNSLPVPDDLVRTNPVNFEFSCAVAQRPIEGEAALLAQINEALASIRPHITVPLPPCLVHGDLFADNTIYRGDTLAAIIDFEEACTDTRLFEIGVTINGFCAPGNQPDTELIDLFLHEYTAASSPLSAEEQAHLHAYIHWGALVMVCWHLKKPTPAKLARVRWHLERLALLKAAYPLEG